MKKLISSDQPSCKLVAIGVAKGGERPLVEELYMVRLDPIKMWSLRRVMFKIDAN